MAGGALEDQDAVDRAFGSENRNRLINKYFGANGGREIDTANAWQHVYRLLLWSDPTTGLAHCYESDKCQPGEPWYGRSLAFHDWLSRALSVDPATLAQEIDWLFIAVCADLSAVELRKEGALALRAAQQRQPYDGRDFPEPGVDVELTGLIRAGLESHLIDDPPAEAWHIISQKIHQYLSVQNKRKNLVGEGFEDVLAQMVKRARALPEEQVFTRSLLYEIPGFNRARTGGKPNKVDLAIVRPGMRTLVTAKWSVRADREKQFQTEFEEYCSAESENQKFKYVFVTNEFDPARLKRACESLARNNLMFDHVVHINTDALRAAYTPLQNEKSHTAGSRREVIEYIDSGRLISLEQWLAGL